VPKLKEIGPFTYRQIREKINIKFDRTNETVSYDQKKWWNFSPDESISKSLGDMNTLWINHINVPLSGTTLNADYAEFMNPVILENELKLFLNHSVGELLFDGYFDLLMEQAKASGHIDVDRFGWMHNQNNSITGAMKIFTGPSNATLDKFGSVDEFNNKREFKVWHNNNTKPADFRNVQCNQFRLSSAGEFFPPPKYSFIAYNNHLSQNSGQDPPDRSPSSGVNSKDQFNQNQVQPSSSKTNFDKFQNSISIFMPDLCRTIKLFYNGTHKHKDLEVNRYVADERTYKYWSQRRSSDSGELDKSENESMIESNRCYCNYNELSQTLNCPPNGMMDLFQCQKGSPVTISFPHFLYSQKDPTLEPYLRLFDIEPNGLSERDYEFFIDLDTSLNMPVKVQIVFQFNVHLRYEKQLNFTKDYSFLFKDPKQPAETLNDLYLPQMWIKSTAEIDHANLENLKFIQKHLGLVTPFATIITFFFASILLMASAKLAYDLTYGPSSRLACDEESCSGSNRPDNLCLGYMEEKRKYLDTELLKKKHNHCSGIAAEAVGGGGGQSNGCDGKRSTCRRVLGLTFGKASHHQQDEREHYDCACGKQSMISAEPTTSAKLLIASNETEPTSKSTPGGKGDYCVEEKDNFEESRPLNGE